MMKEKRPLGLYIHIPFCAEKCRYCDFLSFGGTDAELQRRYVDALLKEMAFWDGARNTTGRGGANRLPVDTVFVGGGTPSLLGPSLLGPVLKALPERFALCEPEITMEANPGTTDLQDLQSYRALGVHRLSLGVQSFDDGLLSYMGRIHNAATATETFRQARAAGFDNINLDLIFAVPGQTLPMWKATVETALSLEPEHLSFYSLQIEEGTPFFELYQKGELQPLSDELDREMYHWAVDRLQQAGYRHYEISNAARPGYECHHNLKYWSMDDYLGLGLGAHSFLDGERFSNETDLQRYLAIAETLGAGGAESCLHANTAAGPAASPYTTWRHTNTRRDNIAEFLFTGLRKTGGISLAEFRARFGVPIEDIFSQELQRHISAGLLKKEDVADHLRFTPKGIDLSNHVLSDFV